MAAGSECGRHRVPSRGSVDTRRAEPAESDGALTVLEIKPDFYMIAGAGSNVAVHIGRDGVVVTDAGRADAAEALLAAIRRLTPRPIVFVIKTSADPDTSAAMACCRPLANRFIRLALAGSASSTAIRRDSGRGAS